MRICQPWLSKDWWGHLDPMRKGCHNAIQIQLKTSFNKSSSFNQIMRYWYSKIMVSLLKVADLLEVKEEAKTPCGRGRGTYGGRGNFGGSNDWCGICKKNTHQGKDC